jgi:uncharacterized protein YjbI with pentapeptide repeats
MSYRFHSNPDGDDSKKITVKFSSGKTYTLGIDEHDTVLSLKKYIWTNKLNGLTAGYGRIVLSGTSPDDAYNLYDNIPKDVLIVTIKDRIIGPGVDLRGENFEGENFEGVDLSGADLSDSNLNRVEFSKSNLSHANLSRANLSGVEFSKTNLSYANLSGAILIYTIYIDTDLSYATLSRTNLAHSYFENINLTRANLSRANLSHANLEGATLRRSVLRKAHLIETKLKKANLAYANLTKANLTKADLSDAILIETNLSETTFIDTILERADLTYAKADLANFSGAKLEGAILIEANLGGSNLDGVKLPLPNENRNIIGEFDLKAFDRDKKDSRSELLDEKSTIPFDAAVRCEPYDKRCSIADIVDDEKMAKIIFYNRGKQCSYYKKGNQMGERSLSGSIYYTCCDEKDKPPHECNHVTKIVTFKRSQDFDDFYREVRAHQLAAKAGLAPEIVKVYLTATHGIIIMQKMKETLSELIDRHIAIFRSKKTSEKCVRHIVRGWATEIGTLLVKLHQLGMLHNDAHRNNFMVDENGKFYMIDFGKTNARHYKKIIEDGEPILTLCDVHHNKATYSNENCIGLLEYEYRQIEWAEDNMSGYPSSDVMYWVYDAYSKRLKEIKNIEIERFKS